MRKAKLKQVHQPDSRASDGADGRLQHPLLLYNDVHAKACVNFQRVLYSMSGYELLAEHPNGLGFLLISTSALLIFDGSSTLRAISRPGCHALAAQRTAAMQPQIGATADPLCPGKVYYQAVTGSPRPVQSRTSTTP